MRFVRISLLHFSSSLQNWIRARAFGFPSVISLGFSSKTLFEESFAIIDFISKNEKDQSLNGVQRIFWRPRHNLPYVVYFGAHSHGHDATLVHYEQATEKHYNFLESFLGSKEKAKDAVFYSYQKHINGFAAKLEEEEALAISKHTDVISIFPDKLSKLQITRSWAFMGLERNGEIPAGSIWEMANFGKDTIIATLDSGVWPESKCFKDEGMESVPKRWKGSCQNNTKDGVLCNRKIIGAKYFVNGYLASGKSVDPEFRSPRDFDGHGTHTLSTLGCRFVPGANAFNHANGTAKGGSPAARVAVYKTCWDDGRCSDSDVLAAIDEAIHDGVDVLSASISSGQPRDYLQDGISVGGFHAVMHGITVVCAAGNGGPSQGTVANVAPWLISVAASTLDRDIKSYVRLGNNQRLWGRSFSPDSLPKKMYPLIYAEDAVSADGDPEYARVCVDGQLDPVKAKGKIVVCDVGISLLQQKSQVVKDAGGVGVILANNEEAGGSFSPQPYSLPATQISYDDSLKLFSYLNSTKSPVAYISFPQTVYGQKPNPQVAYFSSRGPNIITPSVLKPDITAPGVQILGAYSEYTGPSNVLDDLRGYPFVFLDGTSMATPHVSGVVGLLKSLHPDWTTATIRSAIMTTATNRDNRLEAMIDGSSGADANPYACGAGFIRPNRSMTPGLVYDISADDYLNFMCALGYNSTQLDVLRKHQCPTEAVHYLDLNYPSISVPNLHGEPVVVTRKLKNVGHLGKYTARVANPMGVSIVVEPSSLTFTKSGEEKSFQLTFRRTNGSLDAPAFGKLTWSDDERYFIKSPISVSAALH